MEKRVPFFLTKLFRRNPQNSESSEANGWGNTTDDVSSNGWGSIPGSTSSEEVTNDELFEKHYNGWGSSRIPSTPEAISNGWMHEQPNDEYNGWGSGSNAKYSTAKPNSNGCNGWTDGLPEDHNYWWDRTKPNPIYKQAETDMGSLPIAESKPVNIDSWAPVIPSAPPLPDESFNEEPAPNVSKNDGASGSSCVVCWEAQIEGACVPCGHMAGCMLCLKEIESKQGTCPVCRAKIDQVMKIYAI